MAFGRNNEVSDYIKVERSRETRLWISNVILPVVGLGIYVDMLNPELKTKIKAKGEEIVNKAKAKVEIIFKPKKKIEED